MSRCPSCGFDENEDSPICLSCGSPLTVTVEENIAAPVAEEEEEEETPVPVSNQSQGQRKNFFHTDSSLDGVKKEQGQGHLAVESTPDSYVNHTEIYAEYNTEDNAESYAEDNAEDNAESYVEYNTEDNAESYVEYNTEDNTYDYRETPIKNELPAVYIPANTNVNKEKNKNLKLVIILVSIIVVILGSAGAFGYIYYHDKQEQEKIIAENQATAKSVSDQIAALGDISIEDADAVTNARNAYDGLTADQKKYVENENTLVSAEAQLVSVKEAKKVADAEKAAAERQAQAEKEAAERQIQAQKSTLVRPPFTTYFGCGEVIANGGLKLRYGPGTDYNSITTIPEGNYVDIYGESGSWYFVEYGNRQGWVSSEYIW